MSTSVIRYGRPSVSSFALSIKQFCDKTKANVDQVNRKVCLEILSGVVMKSPVKTGWFRGNWQVGENNQLKTASVEDKDVGGDATISKGSSVIDGLKAGGVVWISNNLPYARRLEYGWSGQAPFGVVRMTLNDVASNMDRIVAGVKDAR